MMYLRNAMQELFGCDYPGCDQQFSQKLGAQCAEVKDGKVFAYCATHAVQLKDEGVTLTGLTDANLKVSPSPY